jgi:hypothetical protein
LDEKSSSSSIVPEGKRDVLTTMNRLDDITIESLSNGLRNIGLLALPSLYRYDRLEESRLEKRDKKVAREAKAASVIPKGDLQKKYNKWTPDSR